MASRFKRKFPWGEDEFLHDGIHLNFGTQRYYTKVAGAQASFAALTSLFTFTGGNQSMYMGPGGLLVASATNTPRIEYDANGNCLGLLMEGARTNLALHSADGTNVAWTKSNTSAAKTATGPDGATNSATTVTASSGNGTILQTVTSGSATRALSVWLKRRTGTGNVDLTLDGGTGWTTQTITSSWARYALTQAAVTNPNFGIRLVTSGDAVDFFGFQLESAAFASSHIPTTTVGVARTADSCIRTLSSEFSATAGTAVVIVSDFVSADVSANNCIASLDDATANERLTLQRTNTAGAMRLNVFDGGANQAAVDGLSAISTAGVRLAYAYAANDFAISGNGGAVATDAAGTLPTVTRLDLGSRLTGEHLFGHILRFDYWPTRLPNGFLSSY